MGCSAQLALAVLVLMISTAAAQAPAAAANSTAPCPINDFSKVDWTPAKAQCAQPDSPDFCTKCVCGVGLALVLGLDAAGTTINGKPIISLATEDPAATSSLLGVCQTPIGLAVLQSGAVSSAAVSKLAQCNVEEAGRVCLSEAPAGAVSALWTSSAASASVRPLSGSSMWLLAVAAVLGLQLALA